MKKAIYLILTIVFVILYFLRISIIDYLTGILMLLVVFAFPIIGCYYLIKFKMMMHGGCYSSKSANYGENYEYKKSSYEEENKNTDENKKKNYEYEGTLKGEYDELGIDYNISDEGLKKNHKKLARMYHPDMHSDKSEKEIKIYEDKFKKINEAYENIKKYRGIV